MRFRHLVYSVHGSSSHRPRFALPTELSFCYFSGFHAVPRRARSPEDFDGGSDLDFLFTSGAGFRRGLAYGPWAQNRMAEELSELLGRKVDLIERSQIEKHRNWIRREHILSTAQPIYVEG